VRRETECADRSIHRIADVVSHWGGRSSRSGVPVALPRRPAAQRLHPHQNKNGGRNAASRRQPSVPQTP
jgi:hypothetical protein